MSGNAATPYSIKQLFKQGDTYSVPLYQRNYAWGYAEITQLIQDIIDYVPEDKNKHNTPSYYVGSLVVYKRTGPNNTDKFYEVIDGQQRLTTINIILCIIKEQNTALKDAVRRFADGTTDYDEGSGGLEQLEAFKRLVENKQLTKFSGSYSWFTKPNIVFFSRENANHALDTLFHNPERPPADLNADILRGYKIATEELNRILKENPSRYHNFVNYLFDYVKVIVTEVPPETNLNHYFEIMNSRGEQLEKHEILKSHLLSELQDDENASYVFNTIWEACSAMDTYVQRSFVTYGQKLFGDNFDKLPATFDDIVKLLSPDNQTVRNAGAQTLNELIKSEETLVNKSSDPAPVSERFQSIINFPNFLLQVLRVQYPKDGVVLDDKKLLDTFKKTQETHTGDKRDFVKLFAYNLLKCRLLFDSYIIKRDSLNSQDRWSLKKAVTSGNYNNTFDDGERNNKLIMLLSMFHTAFPALSYKHWLTAALNYLFTNTAVVADGYIEYLEYIAAAITFDRILSDEERDYDSIVFCDVDIKNKAYSSPESPAEPWTERLRYGKLKHIFIFNYLDYLLWNPKSPEEKVKRFSFTFRSSIEHFYPQTPISKEDTLSDDKMLHSFGNLCLISAEKNSRLSNFMPVAKADFYSKSPTIDSIKQHLMIQQAYRWKEAISTHESEMIKYLVDALNNVRKNIADKSRVTDF